jgi:hypothetical protein
MNNTIAPPDAPAPVSGGTAGTSASRLLDAALHCAEDRHWDVFPGTWLIDGDGGTACSCGDTNCRTPGAHPTGPEWSGQATGSAVIVRRLWSRRPLSSVLLPTGRAFDAIDVTEAAGCLALARLERHEVPLGPVLSLPNRRMAFLVLPGAATKVPAALRRLGRSPAALDLVVRADGDYVPAPPTRIGTLGRVRWARQPTAANRWLPDADTLTSTLAYACGRA